MRLARWIGVLAIVLCAVPAQAQFFPQPVYYPVPVYPPSGIGIFYQTGRLRVGGFIPFASPYSPYASINNNVTFAFSGPTTYVVSPRRLVAVEDFYNDVDDLAGIDLDAKPLARNIGIANRQDEKPAAAPVQPAPPPKKEAPPLPEYERLLEFGRVAFRERLYVLAALRFRQAVKEAPLDAQGHFLLAQAQFAQGRYREAAAAIEEGMRWKADWPAAAFSLRDGLFKGAEDELNGLTKLLRETVMRHPKEATYEFLLAHQLWFDGQRGEALVLFRHARTLAANPVFIDAFLKHANQVAAR